MTMLVVLLGLAGDPHRPPFGSTMRMYGYGCSALVAPIVMTKRQSKRLRKKSSIVPIVVDDVPNSHKVVTDLLFFEDHFKGVLPFEIAIDAKKPRRATTDKTLKKIDKLYGMLSEYEEFSRPL